MMEMSSPHKRNSLIQSCPPYEYPPRWFPPEERCYLPEYSNNVEQFLPRQVKLCRVKLSDALGFNVRGGNEHYCGIYISKVMPNTEAERLGLKEGDQILTVNEMDFEDIDHSTAVKILKSNISILMYVRYFPYGYNQTYERPKPVEYSDVSTASY